MIDQTAVFGQFKGRVLHAYGLIYAAWLAVSDFMVDMFHAENIAKLGYRWQPSTSSHQFDFLEATLGSFGPADMFAARGFAHRYYLPYLLGVTDYCPDY